MQVGTVEAVKEAFGRGVVEKLGDDFVLCFGIGRSGEGGDWDVQGTTEIADPKVIGAEIMAPLADAMGLVHGNERHARAAEETHGTARCKLLGRDVEKLECAAIVSVQHRIGFFERVGAGECSGRNARLLERSDLVAHERNERRDDDGDSVPHQSGELETQGFAAACGHDGQNVVAFGNGCSNLGHAEAEVVESKNIA